MANDSTVACSVLLGNDQNDLIYIGGKGSGGDGMKIEPKQYCFSEVPYRNEVRD
jgi:hypothetical protein